MRPKTGVASLANELWRVPATFDSQTPHRGHAKEHQVAEHPGGRTPLNYGKEAKQGEPGIEARLGIAGQFRGHQHFHPSSRG